MTGRCTHGPGRVCLYCPDGGGDVFKRPTSRQRAHRAKNKLLQTNNGKTEKRKGSR